jgi:hypothetical protein
VHHLQELARAAGLVRATFAEVGIETCFIDFEGVWQDGEKGSLPVTD